ncbi:MAG: N-acetylmuramoyl-L-alanine amidase [bacterium]|nr:AMIN domain-containing protein [Gammaproteobacteria bacterium]HIL94749.1 AMIN domain-containing protein [Pseudomonadales bacterium]
MIAHWYVAIAKRPVHKIAVVLSLFLSLTFIDTCLANVASIDSVRVRQSPERTRIVFDLSTPVEHKILTLANPLRLVIDIEGAQLDTVFDQIELGDTPILKMRSAARGKNDLRVVLDLSDQVKPRSFILKPILQYGDRLVVDLYTADQQIVPVQQADRISQQMRDVVVAIDAGHGGDDPGAIARGRLYEKNIVLGIAEKLAGYFANEPGYKAVLIRKGDYFISLRKRTEIARNNQADVFLSIHADAFKTAEAKGASVYAISQRGATSETARWLAEKENRADLIGGVGGVSLDDKDDLLAFVLLDLFMTDSLAASLEMGDQVLNAIKSVNRLHKKRVEQASFAVLKSPDIPSLLIETGYISNPAEARRLKTKSHQAAMARAIFQGVNRYFKSKPPEGSYLDWKKRGGGNELATYRIESGDTLSDIAVKYRVSAKSLMKVNGLRTEMIRTGQVLKIPSS